MELSALRRRAGAHVAARPWAVLPVGSIARFSSGKGISVASLREYSPEYPTPVYGGNGIAGYTDTAMVEVPTVVVGRVGQRCGEVHFAPGPSWVTDNALFPARVLRPLDMRFFAFALSAVRLNDVKNRNDLPLLTQSILHDVRIAWPNEIGEQEAVASALGDVDESVSSLERLLTKKRDVKAAVLHQLLLGATRLPGFVGEWETTNVGRLGAVSKGRGIRKGDVSLEGPLPCIRYGEIYTHHNDVVRQFRSFISPEVARESRRLHKGDVVFASSGETAEEIGKCVAFVGDEEAYVGSDTVVLSPNGHDPRFLGYLLNHSGVVKQKARLAQGDAVVHISARNLASISVRIPERREQEAIATVLADMDADLAALEQRRDKTKLLKQAMMQELLSGRTRLT